MIKLTCPSCNGSLELPDGLGVAHCNYCGTKILLEGSSSVRDAQLLQHNKELCVVALQAKNYIETIQYCNTILGLAPRDVDAWIDKATATFWLTSGKENRYDEAIGYLKRAAQLAPGNLRMLAIREELTRAQAMWYNQRGTTELAEAVKRWNSGISTNRATAIQQSRESFARAMDNFLTASKYVPDDLTYLDNIRKCVEEGRAFPWSSLVTEKIEVYGALKNKKDAQISLVALREKLARYHWELRKVHNEKGKHSEHNATALEYHIDHIRSQISSLEAQTAYETPRMQFDW